MIKKIIQHRIVATLSASAIAFVIGGFAWIMIAINRLDASGPFILHFNDMAGITSVGDLSVIVFMGIFGIVATVMSFFVSLELDERDPFLGKIMAGGGLIFAILLFIAFASILNVN